MSTVQNLDAGIHETLARTVLPALCARTGRPLRVLSWACSSGTEVRKLHALLDRETVSVIHGADVDPLAVLRARELLSAGVSNDRPRLRYLPADLSAEHSGIAPGCYDVVMWGDGLEHLHMQDVAATVERLRRYVRGVGVLVLTGMRDDVRSAVAARHGLEPWFPEAGCEVFRVEGPPPPPCLDDLAGRRVVAVCGMPRAGTTLLCDAVRTFGPIHGLFVTPRFWRSPIKLEEGARLNAINDDPDSTAADFLPLLREASDWYRVPSELGLVCKLPQMVWRPDLLRCFSTVIMTVRSHRGWLDSAIRYRDTVMHAAGPAAWLPGPVQEHVREHFDGHFLQEYGRCTMQQVEQLDDVLDVEHRVFAYGDRESMRDALEQMGLPGEEVLAEMWQGSRWQTAESNPV